MSEVPSGSTSVSGRKNQLPIGLIKAYDIQKPMNTAMKETIRQDRSSFKCSVRAWFSNC